MYSAPFLCRSLEFRLARVKHVFCRAAYCSEAYCFDRPLDTFASCCSIDVFLSFPVTVGDGERVSVSFR